MDCLDSSGVVAALNEAPADMLQPAGQVGAQWSKEPSFQAQLPGRFTQRQALGYQSHQSTGRALAQPSCLHCAASRRFHFSEFGGGLSAAWTVWTAPRIDSSATSRKRA